MNRIFSSRTNWDLSPNPLTRLLKEKQRAKIHILNLTQSNPTKCGFEYPEVCISKALTQPSIFSYNPHPKGLLEARKAIADYYQRQDVHTDPEQIFLTASTSEAYSFIFRLIANPGDSVLVPRPSYPLFDFLADINDIELKPYALTYDHDWYLDRDSILKAITPQTKAILIVNPNNPTGSYIHGNEAGELIRNAKKYNLAIISDEVFFDYNFHPTPAQSFARTSEVLTFTLNGLSKLAALPQMKVAWVIVNGPSSILSKAIERLEVITDNFLSVGTPIQLALPKILKIYPNLQNQIKRRLELNRQFLKEEIVRHPTCEYLHAQGGWYAILKVPKVYSDDDWSLSILEKENVLVHPGHFYHFDQDGYLVMSLIPPPKDFQEGVEKVLHHISQNS